mgnify:FL=1
MPGRCVCVLVLPVLARSARGAGVPGPAGACPPPACNAKGDYIKKKKGSVFMEEEVTTTVMDTIIAAMADCFDLVGEVVTQITGQPVLLFFLAASLIPVGIGIFKGLRRGAR